MIAGVDEAGRGCAIGPLVISGYLIKEEKIPKLIKLGVKDSKKLSAKKRIKLISKIIDLSEKIATIKLLIDSGADVDITDEDGKTAFDRAKDEFKYLFE